MRTTATVIADSISASGIRLTTLQVRFPRFILAEVNTHRVFSRSYRSSRAVPVAKLIAEVRATPFMPSQFTLNKPGMQGGDALKGDKLKQAIAVWLAAAKEAADFAELLADAGVHKQYANRGLEPYLYVDGVISSTDWANFYELRCHPDAQPEFQELAQLMRDAIKSNTPTYVRPGEWHMPYVTPEELTELGVDTCLKLSAARCAWVSYKPFDQSKASDVQKALATFDKLITSRPMHASPCEHQASPCSFPQGNFLGWGQYRHDLESAHDFA
jgi:thymidylate synthase ThyX